MTGAPRLGPLHAQHQGLGATFTEFAGWLMPVKYSSDLAEHRAVRQAAGIFDISHMAEFVFTGPDAGAFLDAALARRVSTLRGGQARYALLLDAAGGIVDDVIVYRLQPNEFMVVANAANRTAVADVFAARASTFAVTWRDATDSIALIAVQGPASAAILGKTAGLQEFIADALGSYRVSVTSFRGEPIQIARTGYTGEDGFELFVAVEQAESLWQALLSAGREHGLVPAGLAARDTLRLEAGMPLYGHELSRGIRPTQVGLGWAVTAGEPEDVAAPVLVGLVSDGKRAGRAGYAVHASANTNELIGEVTSGALSPTLGYPIAMALVSPDHAAPGTNVYLDVRGTRIPATVTRLPFYRRKK